MRIPLHKAISIAVLTIANLAFVSFAVANPVSGSIAVHASGITYYAQPGDTLMSIAQRWTAKSGNWITLGKINSINKDSNIPIGTPILIPAELLPDEPTIAIVIARSGSITALAADGSSAKLEIGGRVSEGMQITTGANSFLTISLTDESRISLPSNSSVLLTKLRKSAYTSSPRTEVKLLRGRVVSRVSPLDVNKGRFEVHTPLSVAGVRGTHFRVNLGAHRVTTEVLEGQVAVGSPQAPAARMLLSAKGNIITRDAVGSPIDLLPPPQLSGAPYRQDGSTRFPIAPVAGAQAYHVEVAQDGELLHLLAEASNKDNEVVIKNLPEGNYFIRLAALDKSGLEGVPNTLATSITNRVEAAKTVPIQAAPSVANSDKKELLLRWPGAADQKFNVQLARDLDFSWLLFTGSVTGNEIKLPRPSFGTYFARVQSLNADGSSNPFSLAQTLIVTDHWIINDGYPKEASRNTSR